MVHRNKMSPAQRAKQFMPFAALKGFEDALYNTEREKSRIPKPEISEDDANAINSTLLTLSRYDSISITIYEDGYILHLTGAVNWIDYTFKYLLLDFKQIHFKNILFVQIAFTNESP